MYLIRAFGGNVSLLTSYTDLILTYYVSAEKLAFAEPDPLNYASSVQNSFQ